MKKVLLTVIVLMFCLVGVAKADILNPISPTNEKLTATVPTAFDSGTLLTDVTTIVNYLGVKEGVAYNFKLKQWDNTTGATIVTYAPWGLSADLEMLDADGIAGVIAWNIGNFLPVANVPVIKYFSYLYIDAGIGGEEDSNSNWQIAPTVGAEFKFSF